MVFDHYIQITVERQIRSVIQPVIHYAIPIITHKSVVSGKPDITVRVLIQYPHIISW